MSYVTTNDLVKVYRTGSLEVQALRGLNLTLREGEFVSIIGPSGSGKTTLLNILGGLDEPTAGTATVAGQSLSLMNSKEIIEFRRLTVGHIFQTLNLIPTLTAMENIELAMIAAKMPRSKRHERANELLEVVGLSGRAKHKPGELSGGEQQRVAIAAAMGNDPPIILADEPTGELDTTTAQQVVDYLLKINKELSKTILMVTHDDSVARQTHRILRIEDGVIKGEYTPSSMPTEKGATSYIDQVRQRINDLDRDLTNLDKEFKTDKITGQEYFDERKRITEAKKALKDELHRMGA